MDTSSTATNIIQFPQGGEEAKRRAREADVRDDYRLYLIGQGRTAATVSTYVSHLTCYQRWCDAVGAAALSASEAVVLRHVAATIDLFSRSYANTRISFLKSFYRYAAARQLRRLPDPTLNLKLHKEKTMPREPLDQRQLRALIRAADTKLERAVLLVLVGSGIRRSELLGLRLEDIDWTRGTLLIHGKGMKQRTVAPGREAMKALRAAANGHKEGRALPLSKSGLKRLLDSMSMRAGVPSVFPHRLRVTTICGLLDAGVDAIAVSVAAGHSLDMVKHYQRATEGRRALAQQRRHSLADRIGAGLPWRRR